MSNLRAEAEAVLRRIKGRAAGLNEQDLGDVYPPAEADQALPAYLGQSPARPLKLRVHSSSLDGSYLFGNCRIDGSMLVQCDLRGDELKQAADSSPATVDEEMRIKNSLLIQTLVHSCSHDLGSLEQMGIRNTVALPHANIHGASLSGCLLGPMSTVDMTGLYDCVVGAFSYVQGPSLADQVFEPGRVWVCSEEGGFEFDFRHDPDQLHPYFDPIPAGAPTGRIMDLIHEMDRAQSDTFAACGPTTCDPSGASFVSPLAVMRGDVRLDDNVLVAQRSYVRDARLGSGANVQENCCVINARLDGLDVTAHGGKIIGAHLGRKVFVGFNSLVRGGAGRELRLGQGCVVMPHTIIDAREPLEIEAGRLVWGLIRDQADLRENSMLLSDLAKVRGLLEIGGLHFTGNGQAFVSAFEHRIQHILEANGAFYDGERGWGHAQEHTAETLKMVTPDDDLHHGRKWPDLDIG